MNGNNGKGWSGKTRGGSFGYRFFIVLIDRLGVRLAYVFLAFVVIYFIPFAPKATAASWWYARNILKKNRFRSSVFLFANYYRFGQTLIDKMAVSAGKKGRYEFVFDESYPRFLEMLNRENGAIMVSAHVGSWEIGAPFFDKYGKKMHVAMLDAEYRKIKEMLEQHGGERNYNVLPLDETDGLSNIFRAKDILDRHEYICFQGDRFLGNAQTAGVGFLGRTARFPIGPFLLASRLRVPVIFYFSMRERGMKYKFYFRIARVESAETGGNGTEPAVKTGANSGTGFCTSSGTNSGTHSGTSASTNSETNSGANSSTNPGTIPGILLLEQYVRALEEIVLQYPRQWFNYYRFWEK